jgi:hypothetical protein
MHACPKPDKENAMKTLRFYLALVCTLWLAAPAEAQIQPRFGMVGGLNLAKISVAPDDGGEYGYHTAYGLGGMVEVGLGRYVALAVEPTYLQKGTALDEPGDPRYKASYIEVPVLMRLALHSRPAHPYLVVGPTVGFFRSGKLVNDEGEEAKVDELNKRDFGLILGAGMRIPAGKTTFFVEGRYALGMANIYSESDYKVKNRGIQVMAGITVPLGR